MSWFARRIHRNNAALGIGEAPPQAKGIAHLPQPGPDHWAWRCLICGERVDAHMPWYRLLFRRNTN